MPGIIVWQLMWACKSGIFLVALDVYKFLVAYLRIAHRMTLMLRPLAGRTKNYINQLTK